MRQPLLKRRRIRSLYAASLSRLYTHICRRMLFVYGYHNVGSLDDGGYRLSNFETEPVA